jgi:hypothetical protein
MPCKIPVPTHIYLRRRERGRVWVHREWSDHLKGLTKGGGHDGF